MQHEWDMNGHAAEKWDTKAFRELMTDVLILDEYDKGKTKH